MLRELFMTRYSGWIARGCAICHDVTAQRIVAGARGYQGSAVAECSECGVRSSTPSNSFVSVCIERPKVLRDLIEKSSPTLPAFLLRWIGDEQKLFANEAEGLARAEALRWPFIATRYLAPASMTSPNWRMWFVVCLIFFALLTPVCVGKLGPWA